MDHTIALIQKAHEGDKEAREQLVKENVGLIWSVVKRFYGRGTDAEDLFQIGSIGLLKAIDKFDLSYDVRFSTYAVPMISGEIKRFLRDDGMIKVSRSLKELSYKLFQAREEMTAALGREPTIEELSLELHVEKEEIVQAMEAGGEVESIYKPIHQKEGSEIRLMDKLVEKEHQEDRILDSMLLQQLLETLDKEERRLIYLRYFKNQTQSAVGKKLGISQVQVSRMEKKIMAACLFFCILAGRSRDLIQLCPCLFPILTVREELVHPLEIVGRRLGVSVIQAGKPQSQKRAAVVIAFIHYHNLGKCLDGRIVIGHIIRRRSRLIVAAAGNRIYALRQVIIPLLPVLPKGAPVDIQKQIGNAVLRIASGTVLFRCGHQCFIAFRRGGRGLYRLLGIRAVCTVGIQRPGHRA